MSSWMVSVTKKRQTAAALAGSFGSLGPGEGTSVTVRAVPDVFRSDRMVALKPLVEEIGRGGLPVASVRSRLERIEEHRAPYAWWWRWAGVVLFALGFAPLMQPTWYEIASTAVLAALAAPSADRWPRLVLLLPLVASTLVVVVTLEVFARDAARGGPVLLMLPALFFFVPGDCLSAAAAELGAGLMTTGAIRSVYAGDLLVQLHV
ncbi:threonine/serine exporter family protein [Streptomyces sp. NPDC048324]|uniref:threonine/serine exporter family protein n=1 Tax=Streptomyces sp. NPDC048324 TaxID=3157205 RepID=UPI0034145E0C